VVAVKRNKFLVVIDNDVAFREAIMSLFKNYPVDVLGFSTGEEATEFLCEVRIQPDLVVLDVELKVGGLSGVEVAHKLRETCGLDFPILFLSAEPTVNIWSRHIPGARALSKKNSLKRIFNEITGRHGGNPLMILENQPQ